MPFRVLFFTQLAVIILLGLLHTSALTYSLYWRYVWLDTLSHFLGGLWIALAFAWLFLRNGRTAYTTHIVLAVMVIGVGWELFEFVSGVPREANWLFDTAVDLTLDLIGGVCGAYLSQKIARL